MTVETKPVSERPSSARRVWWTVVVVSVLAAGAAVGRTWVLSKEPVANSGPRAARPKAVQGAVARSADISLQEEYRGELAANTAELAAQATGRVLEVRVDLGDSFKKGDVLAVIDAAETRRMLAEASAQVRAAQATKQRGQAELQAAEVEASRARRLLEQQLLSEQEALTRTSRAAVLRSEIASSEANRQAALARVALYREQLAQAELTAPFDGAVAERYLDPGSTAQPGTRLLRLVETGPLRLRFRLTEEHLSRVQVGAPLWVTTLATGETRHPGKVTRISAEVSRTDRTIAVEGMLEPPSVNLRPGMYATVIVELGELKNATLVPSGAVIEKRAQGEDATQERGVFIIVDGRAHYRAVRVLGRRGDDVALAPLKPGEQVAVFGKESLRDGDLVQLVSSPGQKAEGTGTKP